MRETATLMQGFSYYNPEFRPFGYLEVPGTSLLVAAAAVAGYYPIAEYALKKIGREDRRRRVNGRADLWFAAGDKSYSFEMKRAWDISSEAQLFRCMTDAKMDASRIPPDESDYSYGGVIAPVTDTNSNERYSAFSDADYIFSIRDDDTPHVFFYFSQVDR